MTAFAAAAAAQADPIATDRPDFVEAGTVVGAGRFQIETSVARANDPTERITNTPTLLRYGLSDTLELRLDGEGWQRSRGGGEVRRGGADTTVGLKWHARDSDEDDGVAAIAWLADATLPTGSAPFRGRGVRPSLRLVMEWELPHDGSIGVMPGIFVDSRDGDGGRYAGAMGAVTLGKDWGAVHGFVELAAQRVARQRDGGSVLTFDFGGSYRLNDDMQVDCGFALGLNRNAPDQAVTVGFSVRF